MVQNKLKGIKNSYIRDINFLIYRIDWNSFFPIKKKYHDDRVVNSEICLGKFCLGNQWWQFGCKKEWKRDSKYKNSWDVKKIRSKDYRSFKNVIKLGFYRSLEAITFITSFPNLLLSVPVSWFYTETAESSNKISNILSANFSKFLMVLIWKSLKSPELHLPIKQQFIAYHWFESYTFFQIMNIQNS